jgi:hypothetical protein
MEDDQAELADDAWIPAEVRSCREPNTIEVTTLLPGKVYQFRVSAVSRAGNGPPSEPVRLRTAANAEEERRREEADAVKERLAKAIQAERERERLQAINNKRSSLVFGSLTGGGDSESDEAEAPAAKAMIMTLHAEPADSTTVTLVWQGPPSFSHGSHKYQTELQRLDSSASGCSRHNSDDDEPAWLAATMHMQPMRDDGRFSANIFDLLPATSYRFRLAVVDANGVEMHSEESAILRMPQHVPPVPTESEWTMQPKPTTPGSTAPSSAPSIGGPVTVEVGPPSAPVSLLASEVSVHSVRLEWRCPWSDGGAMIQGYLVEQLPVRDVTEPLPPVHAAWEAATIDIRHGSALSVCVVGLQPDAAYAFRVMAVNDAGCGDPAAVQVATHRP